MKDNLHPNLLCSCFVLTLCPVPQILHDILQEGSTQFRARFMLTAPCWHLSPNPFPLCRSPETGVEEEETQPFQAKKPCTALQPKG